MLQAFAKKLDELNPSNEKVLLAVSSGVDSMVMAQLFLESERPFSIAHCNFQLRGEESDGDEALVKHFAKANQIVLHAIKFDTAQEAKNSKTGIQETARNLRYNWFNELSQQFDYQWIATAHHADDSIESALFNLTRGTGWKGMAGIAPKRQNIIRPLIDFRKSEILAFAERHKVQFRKDSSNEEDKYNRNHLRLNVIPSLQKINPSFEETMLGNMDRFRETNELFQFLINKLSLELLRQEGDFWKIRKSKLQHLPHPASILYEMLADFGFNFAQARDIYSSLENESGAIFNSLTHELLLDREDLIIREKRKKKKTKLLLNENEVVEMGTNVFISGRKINQIPSAISMATHEAMLDFSKLKFPLSIENWQPGDKFQPFGMGGKHQKIQDFLSNNKLSIFEKESVLVLKSAGEICWLIGHRISESFKISSETTAIYHLTIQTQKC